MKKVFYLTFEALPYMKTGGLADVSAILPFSFSDDIKVKIFLPFSNKINKKNFSFKEIDSFVVDFNEHKEEVKLYQDATKDIYFLSNETYLDCKDLYGYSDDLLRYAFYAEALLAYMAKSHDIPDIIHSNDYHTSLIIAYTKLRDLNNSFKNIKHLFTIHNLNYQGDYDKSLYDIFKLDYKYYDNGLLRKDDHINLLKIGICLADKIVTVSPSYRDESLKNDNSGLKEVLEYRKDDYIGIRNGIDIDNFNPKNEPFNYDIKTIVKGKRKAKENLVKEFNLNENKMILGIVSRLSYLKGLDLIIHNIDEILANNVELVVLGKGETKYEYSFLNMALKYPQDSTYISQVDEDMAKRIYAGCDLFLMPSLDEPCGIANMIAMRYGTLALVREVGGLKESVIPYNCHDLSGNGFSFKWPNDESFMTVLKYAIDTYYNHPKVYLKLQKEAMRYDSSFKNSAKEYEKIYQELTNEI